VDDEVDGRDLVRFVLEDCGAEVVTAESGKHALDLLAQRKPDVIVSDIGMPEMDGYEFIKLAQQRTGRRIPAIALTAFARSEDRTRALQAGFIMHVAKPVEADEFLASVASIVASQCG
jgi:CheY-like chemotaxis protein